MRSDLETLAAEAPEALGGVGEIRGRAGEAAPRFELFHAPNSICSQKVRAVLEHHGMRYISRSLNLFLGQTYLPEYVRLRMLGCEQYGGALAAHHSGSTSASAGGCDGAVVPTLVDWQAGAVIVDSKRICLYLDWEVDETNRLCPPRDAAAIEAQLEVVDNLPNYQMLMGRTPTKSEAGVTSDNIGGSFSQRKVAWCDRYLDEYPADPVLVKAYSAKRAKELSAAKELFSPNAMQAAYRRAQSAVNDLEIKLGARVDPWLHGSKPMMSDLFWGIELLRMEEVGLASFWQDGAAPRVERYLVSAREMPAVHKAIIEWPGARF